MLYQLHDFQRSMLAPFVALADLGAKAFSSPFSPLAYTPVSRRIAAHYELLYRLGKDYEKPAWNLPTTQVDGVEVAVTERVILDLPFCKLIHFQRALPRERTADPRVLVVAPLSGHHATLLRDTVRALLPQHEVYITDWIDARMVPQSQGPFHLSDYVHYVQDFIRLLGPDVHVMAVCQPTVPVLAAVSLMAARNDPQLPRSMILMGGPVDPRCSPTQVNNLASTKPFSWFDNRLIHRVPPRFPGSGRKVYPGFLQHTGFVAMNPDRHMQSHYDFYKQLVQGADEDAEAHRRFYDEYNAVLDMPAEYYLDTIKTVFQEYALPRGTWEIDGQIVDPSHITTVALFTIEGELDDISGLGQTEAAQRLCSNLPASMKRHYIAPKCGHYGIFSGRRWRQTICPQVAEFIRQHAHQAASEAGVVPGSLPTELPASEVALPDTAAPVAPTPADTPVVSATPPVVAEADEGTAPAQAEISLAIAEPHGQAESAGDNAPAAEAQAQAQAQAGTSVTTAPQDTAAQVLAQAEATAPPAPAAPDTAPAGSPRARPRPQTYRNRRKA